MQFEIKYVPKVSAYVKLFEADQNLMDPPPPRTAKFSFERHVIRNFCRGRSFDLELALIFEFLQFQRF